MESKPKKEETHPLKIYIYIYCVSVCLCEKQAYPSRPFPNQTRGVTLSDTVLLCLRISNSTGRYKIVVLHNSDNEHKNENLQNEYLHSWLNEIKVKLESLQIIKNTNYILRTYILWCSRNSRHIF